MGVNLRTVNHMKGLDLNAHMLSKLQTVTLHHWLFKVKLRVKSNPNLCQWAVTSPAERISVLLLKCFISVCQYQPLGWFCVYSPQTELKKTWSGGTVVSLIMRCQTINTCASVRESRVDTADCIQARFGFFIFFAHWALDHSLQLCIKIRCPLFLTLAQCQFLDLYLNQPTCLDCKKQLL